MVSLFLSNVIVTCVFLVSILSYNPCHIPLKYRRLHKIKCLIKACLPWLQISTEGNYVSNSFLAFFLHWYGFWDGSMSETFDGHTRFMGDIFGAHNQDMWHVCIWEIARNSKQLWLMPSKGLWRFRFLFHPF